MGYNGVVISPWSISTAVREPSRLPGFLRVLKDMSGAEWNDDAQVEYQIRLLQARLYGFGNKQFYQGLPKQDIELLESGDDIPFDDAHRIFTAKNYKDPPMRGRNSFKPLEKLGFATIADNRVQTFPAIPNRRVQITESGEALLEEAEDYADIFMRVLLKWEIPNVLDKQGFPPKDGYNIKPFVGFLRLIDAVNDLCQKDGMKAKGLSFLEVMGFGVTLIDYRKINKTARDIVDLRRRAAPIPHTQRDDFCKREIARLRPGYQLKNARDYADNALRYFRLTKYVRISEWGKYVNLEPMRQNELSSLFDRDDARPDFQMKPGYAAFLASAKQPDLPGETKPELTETVNFLATHSPASVKPKQADIKQMDTAALKKLRNSLRVSIARAAGEKEKAALRNPVEVENCI
ncbi:MAG: AlwI family type II restriction endonuclease, partial [Gammaproteobacteria bacterium]